MNLFSTLKNLFKSKRDDYLVTHKKKRTQARAVNRTDSYTVDGDLTHAMYRNTFPGLTFASSLAHPIINIPVSFMGLPEPTPRDEGEEAMAEELTDMVAQFSTELRAIHAQCHRDGTVWILPTWDAKAQRLSWEFIPDASISDIIRDINTGDIQQVWTHERITIAADFGKTATFTRKRKFTRAAIFVTYSDIDGTLPQTLRDTTIRNAHGVLPIPFANNADHGDVRGHSDFERIMPLLKQYHDLSEASAVALARFSPKLVINTKDPETWETESESADISEISLMTIEPEGKVSLLTPDRVSEPFLAKQKQLFLMILESVGIPELFFGGMASGNHASVEESMTSLIKLVKAKQNAKNKAYIALFTASLIIQRRATINTAEVSEITMGWGELDGISQKTKSEILTNFTTGISKAMQANSMTPQQMYELWRGTYPDETETTYELFLENLKETAAINQMAAMSYAEGIDFTGSESDNDE